MCAAADVHPQSLLLHGPPGCGKGLLAHAMLNEDVELQKEVLNDLRASHYVGPPAVAQRWREPCANIANTAKRKQTHRAPFVAGKYS
jgi:hypothetical protein